MPPPRLVVVGAVDTAESLCRMARALGWRTAVDRSARYLRDAPSACPSADRLVVGGPEQGYDELERRPADAVVVLTHDPKLDDPGDHRGHPPRRRLHRRARLAAHAGEALATRLRESGPHRRASSPASSGPVGLDIGAHTPEETAVSILAEVIASRSGRDGGRLISGSGGIHAIDESLEARVPSPEC